MLAPVRGLHMWVFPDQYKSRVGWEPLCGALGWHGVGTIHSINDTFIDNHIRGTTNPGKKPNHILLRTQGGCVVRLSKRENAPYVRRNREGLTFPYNEVVDCTRCQLEQVLTADPDKWVHICSKPDCRSRRHNPIIHAKTAAGIPHSAMVDLDRETRTSALKRMLAPISITIQYSCHVSIRVRDAIIKVVFRRKRFRLTRDQSGIVSEREIDPD